MSQLNVTALACPAMIERIRLGIRLAVMGQGERMNGHAHRVYIPNRHGRNVMRLDWDKAAKRVVIYGQESVNVTDTVKAAMRRAQSGKNA